MSGQEWIDDGYFVTERRDLKRIRQVLLLTMLLNFVATAIKLGVGLATGALSVLADGLDSLFDGISNIVGLVGLYAAGRPPDARHPYGYRKFETLAALSIAFLLFFSCWQLLVSAWNRLGSSNGPQVNLWTGLAMAIAMFIQLGTSLYELRQGRRLRSEILVADALHTRASILVSLTVLGGLALVWLGYPQVDPLLAAFVALVIAKIGVDIVRETLPVLVDVAPVNPVQIAEVVEEVGGVESFHRVRSRGPFGSAAIDLHVRVSPEKTVQEANAIADEVRRRLLSMEGVTDVTVHVEAQRRPAPEEPELFAMIKYTAGELGLTVHEVWAHRIGVDLYTEMHVGVEPDLTLGEAHELVNRLEQELRRRIPELKGVHTHIEVATTQVQQGDRAPLELEQRVQLEAEEAVAQLPFLSHPHNIQVRRDPVSGDNYYIVLECSVAPDTPVAEAHHLASLLEHELCRRLVHVTEVSVHLEPPDG